jgi:glycosyltransferase involved in cell wall biosynthesis
VLLEALSKVPGQYRLEAKIYGDLSLYPDYSTKLVQHSASDSRIKFCGTFLRENIADVFDQFDVLVIPSLWHENTPLVALHAQAARCPIVGSRVTGISEIVRSGDNGILYEPGNPFELAAIIINLLENKELLPHLVRNAVVPKTIFKYTQELLNTYRQICPAEAFI